MNVGELTYFTDDRGNIAGFVGRIRTLKLSLSFKSRDARQSESRDAPTHEIIVGDVNDPVQVGVAWQKTLERGEHAGARFLTMAMDDPSFDQPLYVTAFPRERGDRPEAMRCDVVWNRRRGTAGTGRTGDAAAAPAGAPATGNGRALDDEIPF